MQQRETILNYLFANNMNLEITSIDGAYSVQEIKQPEAKVESSNEERKSSEYSEYDKINKPFLSKSKIVENTEQYATFLSLFKIPRGSRAKRMSRRKIVLT